MAANRQLTGVNFEKVLQSLQEDVENLKTEYEESGCHINDDNINLHQLCDRIEFLFTCGLKERVGLLGGRRDVWHYLCRCLADRRNIHDGLKVVKANTELKTGVGRLRCLVRYCLVQRCLADVIQQCVQNVTVTRQCYQEGAPILHPTLSQTFYSTLYHLSDMYFDLPPSGSDLDLAWPTFARHGMGRWQPPSRTLSVSSLFSQISEAPSLQSPSTAVSIMDSVGETHIDHHTSMEIQDLNTRISQLEENNTKLRQTCSDLQSKLDQVQDNSQETEAAEKTEAKCCNCELLSKQLNESQDETQKLRELKGVLEGQVKVLEAKVVEFEAEEKIMKEKIKELDMSAGELKETNTTDKKLHELEIENETLKEQCKAAEIEKTTLRTNIRKVSANWFERKTRLSDSDSEEGVYGRPERKDEGVQVPEEDVLLKFSSLFKKVEDMPKLLAEISFTTGKLDLTERICCELRKRVKDYEKVIDDQEIIIHGLQDQLDTYFSDNQKMSQQLSSFSRLFEDLEITERTKVNLVSPPDNSNSSFPTLPSEEEFREMSGSVSKTYTKLKELILEKKSLVTEIERLKVLNIELHRRVSQQETRLTNVSDALHSTWLVVSDMKEQHAQLHSHESILRYELKGKRELLHRLRDELECSREQWHKIRRMNTQSEETWNNLREELNERQRLATDPVQEETPEEPEGAVAVIPASEEFEPPIDLLLDMAIEYGVIDADDDTSTAMVAAMEGQDMRASRLEDLENQCSYLYQKLMASTARSLTLASRLSTLHHHFGSSDEEDDYDEDDDEDEEEDDDDDIMENDHNLHLENHANLDLFETDIQSADTESSDTAYVSEADSGGSSGAAGNLSEEDAADSISPSEEPVDVEGDLSKRLINFLPRKIEILHRENRRLEERCELLHHEKLTTEAQLGQALQGEKQQRKQLEEQLEHLGKCVDELKLERNGKISEVEEHLKQKMEKLGQREDEYDNLQSEVESMQEKMNERGNLLHIANERVKQLEEALKTHENNSQETLTKLRKADDQLRELQSIHDGLNSEYNDIKEEVISLQKQVADLRFQVSSKDMERHAAEQANVEKVSQLEELASESKTRAAQVDQLTETVRKLEEQISQIEEEYTTEKATLTTQLDELTQTLHQHKLQLQQSENKTENAQQTLSKKENELKMSKEEFHQLNQDNEQLREKIIQLLREKDALWQTKRVLEGVIGGCAGEWMDDNSVKECIGCQAVFSLTRRRHHCRTCGQIFCSGCSDNWLATSASRKRVRVCDDCFSVQAELAAIVASPTSPTTTLLNTESDRMACSNPVAITSTTQPNDDEFAVISEDELESSRQSCSPDSSESSPNTTTSGFINETPTTLHTLTPETLNSHPPTNSEVWVAAGSRVLVPVDLPAGVALHWNFISEPKSVSFAVLHQPPMQNNSPLEEVVPAEPDSADSQHRVLAEESAAAESEQQKEGAGRGDVEQRTSSQQRVLIPTTRVASAQGSTIRGRLLAKQPGVYTLVFDNSSSRLTAKKVTYSLNLHQNPDTQQQQSSISPPNVSQNAS